MGELECEERVGISVVDAVAAAVEAAECVRDCVVSMRGRLLRRRRRNGGLRGVEGGLRDRCGLGYRCSAGAGGWRRVLALQGLLRWGRVIALLRWLLARRARWWCVLLLLLAVLRLFGRCWVKMLAVCGCVESFRVAYEGSSLLAEVVGIRRSLTSCVCIRVSVP